MGLEQELKLGILGGTFNPIHYGHLMIAENARDQFHLDRVLFMPAGQPPHKCSQKIAKPSARCQMISLAIADNPAFGLDTLEVESKGISYTYLTLQKLKEQHPAASIYFILGADSLFDLEGWREPERLLGSCSFLAAYRTHRRQDYFLQQIRYLNEKYHCEIAPLQTPSLEVSSQEIRKRVACRQTIRYLVPRAVEAYIQEHGIYQDEEA